jgi:L-2-hydroxyglutarate oxidase LhgO
LVQEVDCVVIGAGVVGIAVARALAQAKREVVVIEAADAIGTGISGRNSEVIHAGLYYPKNSQKAQLCVRGRRLLYQLCQEAGVPHRETGKLVVATTQEELPVLHDLHARGIANGVSKIEFLNSLEARSLEPALHCVSALYVPVTGIVNVKALMTAMVAQAEAAGATFLLHTPFRSGRATGPHFELECGLGTDATKIRSRVLVNAAGLNAQSVAGRITRMQAALIPPLHLNKGVYFSIAGTAPFQRLVYPVPRQDGLGIHFTIDMAGQGRFGPDDEWVDTIDYSVDPRRAEDFYEAIRRYYPDLKQGALQPAFAGIRPKIQAPGGPPADFAIQGRAQHGIRGLVNLFGIESPGLTAALAIAGEVVTLVKQ